MARLFVRASTQGLKLSATVVTVAPLTLACWFKSTDLTVKQSLVGIGLDANGSNYFQITAHGALAGDPITAEAGDGVAGVAVSATGYSSGVWHHAGFLHPAPAGPRT